MIIEMNCEREERTGDNVDLLCVGCGEPIKDQYILRVAPDLEWHASCLRCSRCGQLLDELCTCFVKDGKPYCKTDYNLLFGVKCSGCRQAFCKNDLVMRAKHQLYHVDCFNCAVCQRRLVPGDEFALREDLVLCRADFDIDILSGLQSPADLSEDLEKSRSNEDLVVITTENENSHNKQPEMKTCRISSQNSSATNQAQSTCLSQRRGETARGKCSSSSSSNSSKSNSKADHKTTRVRTVLNEKQLHTLRTCYGANPRPDALMKDQLVEMTGLSSRVIRVWFQNKRCKDKKRTIMIKQLQQQHQDKVHGVPMIASSPVQLNDSSSINIQSVPAEVHHYLQQQQLQLHWSNTMDYSPYHNPLPSDPPPFQQLLNSFGHSSDSDLSKNVDDDNDDTVVSLEEAASYSRIHRTDGGRPLKRNSTYSTILNGSNKIALGESGGFIC